MINGLGGYGGIRMGGLATGLDTDDIIKKMLAGQQAKIDKTKQEREQIQWKQEIYRDIIKDVKNLQNTYFDITSKDNLSSGKAFYDYEVKSSNESIITATAGQGTIEGNYTVDVKQLATGARVSKQLGIDITKSSKLSKVGISGDDFTITIDGKKFEVKLDKGEDSTIEDLASAIKNSTTADGKEKLSKYVDVSFSEISKDFVIETKKTGKDAKIEVQTGALAGFNNEIGKNSIMEVTTPKGGTGIVENEKNNFTIDGVSFNLKGTSDKEKINLNVTKDVDKTFNRFEEFLDKYNELVEKINGKLTEKKEYKYKPLTDEQKKEMKEDDIKRWEERAKKGILRNDSNLEKMLRELRGTLFTSVNGSDESFGRHIGLDTTNDYKTAGQIKFSEDGKEKFKKALLERPEDIMKLFTKKPDRAIYEKLDTEKTPKAERDKIIYENSGIFSRMDSILRNYVGAPGTILNSSILTKYANKQEDHSITGVVSSNNLPDQIYRKDNLIKQLDKKLREREERLYRQFAILEKSMTKYNAQAGWLSQQFGGGM